MIIICSYVIVAEIVWIEQNLIYNEWLADHLSCIYGKLCER